MLPAAFQPLLAAVTNASNIRVCNIAAPRWSPCAEYIHFEIDDILECVQSKCFD